MCWCSRWHLKFTTAFPLFYLFDCKIADLMIFSFLQGKIWAPEKSGASQRFCISSAPDRHRAHNLSRSHWLKQLNIIRQYLLGVYLQNDDQNWLYTQKISKEGNMESKKRFMYVDSRIRLDTHVAFSLCYLSTFWKYSCCYLFYTFKYLFSFFVIDIENVGIFCPKYQDNVRNVRNSWP